MPVKFRKKDKDDINSAVSEYVLLREKKKEIESRMKSLSQHIKEYSESHGVKNDTGSIYCENDSYFFGSVAKKSVSFNQEKAVSFLKLHGFHSAIKSVEVVDEEVIEGLIADGSITIDDLSSITTVKTTYSLDVKGKDTITEVTQLPLAASRRGGRR